MDLSAYLNFSIVIDNSVSPAKVRFIDSSTYPGGIPINGLVEIIQPDGVLATGAVIGTSGSLSPIEIEMRLSASNQIQAGHWRVTYTVNSTGYDETILDRSFDLNYTEPAAAISPLLNVFSPLLRAQDGTNYTIEGFTLQSVVRSWQAVIAGVATVNGGNVLQFDMAYNLNYYDALYNVTMTNIAEWTITDTVWVSVRDTIQKAASYQVIPPPSLETLLNDLNEFKATLDNESCGCSDKDKAAYAYAESLYSHILKRGCYGQTLGLDAYVTELVKVLNGGVSPTHDNTEAVLTAYSWTTPCSGGGGTVETMANIGNGAQVYQSKVGSEFRMRTLVQGTGITITQSGSEILFSVNQVGEANTGTNIGDTGQGLYIGKAAEVLQFRKITQGSGISLSINGSGAVVITNSAIGEANSGQNVGATGAGVYKDKSGSILRFKKLKQGTNVSIVENADDIEISATAPAGSGEANAGQNVGSGVGIYKDKDGVNLRFYRVLGDTATGIRVTKLPNPSDDIAISGPGFQNVGTGENIYKDFDTLTNSHRLRKIKAGTNMSVSIVGDDIVLASTGGVGGTDVTAPSVIYSFLISPTVARIIFDENVAITDITGCSIGSPTNNPIVSVSGSGTNTLDFTVTNAIAYGATVFFSYNSGTGNIRDLAGTPNPLATITNLIVDNTVPIPNIDAIPGVVLTSPSVGQTLVFDESLNLVNENGPAGSGSEEGTF
jgi:hypothetical protein